MRVSSLTKQKKNKCKPVTILILLLIKISAFTPVLKELIESTRTHFMVECSRNSTSPTDGIQSNSGVPKKK